MIREYKTEDYQGLRKCYLELQATEHEHLPHYYGEPESVVDPYLEYLFKSIKENSGKIFVSEIDGEIAGFIGLTLGEDDDPCVVIHKFAYITDLVVLEKFRNRGIGKELMKTAEKFSKDNNRPYLSLNVTRENTVAFELYKKLGFSEYTTGMKKKLE